MSASVAAAAGTQAEQRLDGSNVTALLRCSLPHSRPRHTPSAVAAKAPAVRAMRLLLQATWTQWRSHSGIAAALVVMEGPYLSDHMSLSAPHHLLRVFCWLARYALRAPRAGRS